MKTKHLFWGVLFLFAIGLSSQAATITTFADPSANSGDPLFWVDVTNDTVTGGWADDKDNLNLYAAVIDTLYPNAYFTMDTLTYYGDKYGGDTGGGTIKFFADNQSPATTPLFQITFDKAQVALAGLSGNNIFTFFADNVVFSGSIFEILSGDPMVQVIMSKESFSFSFSNQIGYDNGFQTTASFTSSADYKIIPEPATMLILGIGCLLSFRRR